MPSKLKATVFIPTYNGERYLKDILNALSVQDTSFAFETLIIDSGSTDKTLDIISEFDAKKINLRLHKIANSEYGHGKTRNLAAQLAMGDIVVYLSHDAVPAHDRWLYEMVRPFELNEKIVGVMGKQIARPYCIPMLKYEIASVFSGFGPDFGTTLFYKDTFMKDRGTYDAISFYSDVNSAARRDYLRGKFPYKDVSYAEDQLFGRDVIDAGYYKAYAPRGSVVHSNDLTLGEYKHRMFDETLGLRKVGIAVEVPSKRLIAKMVVRGILRDSYHITNDSDYSFKRKVYWLIVNPLFLLRKWQGVRGGALVELDDEQKQKAQSLEARRAR